MSSLFRHLRLLLISCTALALSAGLVFGATPPASSTGLANAAAHAGKVVPVTTEEETASESDESAGEGDGSATETDGTQTDETQTEETQTEETDTEDVGGTEDPGANCATDPTAATPEELAAMSHGSIVCWAAQQTEWPTWFSNHGAFVRCWAHQGKADAVSCTEDPATVLPTGDEPSADQAPATHGKGHGHGKAKGRLKHQG